MDDLLIRTFLRQVESQGKSVLHAYADLQAALVEPRTKRDGYLGKKDALERRTSEAWERGDLGAYSEAAQQELRLLAEYTSTDPTDHSRVWFSIQNLLVATANLSKLLWGSKGKKTEERRPIRVMIGVPDDSPLSQVDMRNNWEHFDERIETWWRDSKTHNIFEGIGWEPDGAAPIDRFRRYDPSTDRVSFWGDEFNVREIIEAVEELLPSVRAQLYRT